MSPETVSVVKGSQSEALTINTDASDFTMTSENTGIATVDKASKKITGVEVGNTTVAVEAQATGKTKASKKVAVTVTGE